MKKTKKENNKKKVCKQKIELKKNKIGKCFLLFFVSNSKCSFPSEKFLRKTKKKRKKKHFFVFLPIWKNKEQNAFLPKNKIFEFFSFYDIIEK